MSESTSLITNFWNSDYVLSSPDLIAVKHGLKKTTRIQCNNEAEYERIMKDFRKHSLKTVISDKKLFGNHNIYISAKKAWAEKAKEVDPSYKIIAENYSFNDALPWVREYSELLSYPECCVSEYIENTLANRGIPDIKAFCKIPEKIDFRMNNCLNGFSNFYLSFHFPCSWSCRATLKYQSNIFKAIKEESPEYAVQIEKNLKHPFLIFLPPDRNSAYNVWDRREGIVFAGKTSGDTLRYNDCYFFKTHYPDYNRENNKVDSPERLGVIKQGNRIVFKADELAVYKNKAPLKRITKPDFNFYLLNFR
jgi:hypothetical protein